MQNLGERRSSINFLPRSSSQAIDSHKFFNKRLSFMFASFCNKETVNISDAEFVIEIT